MNAVQVGGRNEQVQVLEAGTQTELGTGMSALVAAARDEILRLRDLNQRLLDSQRAGAPCRGTAPDACDVCSALLGSESAGTAFPLLMMASPAHPC